MRFVEVLRERRATKLRDCQVEMSSCLYQHLLGDLLPTYMRFLVTPKPNKGVAINIFGMRRAYAGCGGQGLAMQSSGTLGMNRIFKEEQSPVTTHTFRRKELLKCRHAGVKTRNPRN